jgi:hypothetical protein
MNFKRLQKLSLLSSKENSYLQKERTIVSDIRIQQNKVLQNNLKQLDFIASFEMNLDRNKVNNYSLDFLQEFEKIKYFAQKNTIQSIMNCKS